MVERKEGIPVTSPEMCNFVTSIPLSAHLLIQFVADTTSRNSPTTALRHPNQLHVAKEPTQIERKKRTKAKRRCLGKEKWRFWGGTLFLFLGVVVVEADTFLSSGVEG